MSICLNMIVKNEAHVLPRTLPMLCKHFKFSYWVISDTGSTDGTQDLIRDFFKEKDIPGELIETPWKNFGHNRTVAFQAAYNKSDYVLVWDADDSIVGNFRPPHPLTADGYLFEFGDESGFRYSRMQLFNNRKRWKYVGVLHEYPACEENMGTQVHVVGDYYFVSGREGARNKEADKYKKDAIVLEEGLRDEPDNTRYAFYCGNSYMNANMHEEAIRMYKKTLKMNGWSEEKYMSCISAYNCYEHLGRKEEGLYMLLDAYRHSPTRVEAILSLIKHYAANNQDELAYLFYTLIQEKYEKNHKTDIISRYLFAKKQDFIFYLPYYMIIVATKLNKHELALNMLDIITHHKYTQANSWFIRNLFHNMQFIKDIPASMERLQSILEYREQLPEDGFEEVQNKAISDYIETCRSLLIRPAPSLKKRTCEKPTVFFSITSCKRIDLFKQTVNSILNTWTDLDKIDYFFCVDDNSSAKDRSTMKSLYPFFQFHMKTSEEKGHRASMNIIWSKLQELKPKYWIHMEDDFLFFRRDAYVTKSMNLLNKHESADIHQVLFNRNYAETYADCRLIGGKALEPGYTVHEVSNDLTGPNCGYWPHYSFRPSMVRVERILELGNYDSPNTFFERDYADRWNARSFKSAFFNRVSCMHIGKLTSDKKGTNAYSLNSESQFGAAAKQKAPNMYIVNLARRTDRRDSAIREFAEKGFEKVTLMQAVDGSTLNPTPELIRMFKGNDFNSKRGVIGCALSHYKLWTMLEKDEDNPYYIIFEDDITLTEGFKRKLEELKVDPSWDLLFLGYHTWNDADRYRKPAEGQDTIQSLTADEYVGGTFAYIVTKQGARKLCKYLQTEGCKHGIDYVMVKKVPDIVCKKVQPQWVLSEWVRNGNSTVDSDIQRCNDSLPMSCGATAWLFGAGLDSHGGDMQFIGKKPVNELLKEAEKREECIAVNTLGFLKSTLDTPLKPSQYFGEKDGLFIRMVQSERPEGKIRVKLCGDFFGAEAPANVWAPMLKEASRWNSIHFVTDDTEADYWVVLNKPAPGTLYDPRRTLVYHFEPPAGVRSWGLWANPTHCAHVFSASVAATPAAWCRHAPPFTQLLEDGLVENKTNTIAHIASHKYIDPGHRLRIDFMRLLEEKGEPTKVYGRENYHKLSNYVGPVPDEKIIQTIRNHKYYLMCENYSERNYVTEKLWEPILAESLCFYWGCTNITEILDPEAYVLLDMTKPEEAYETVKRALAEDWWSQRLPAIRRAKHKIMTELNFFATLEKKLLEIDA